jgi:hypothetical protein
MSDDTTVEAVLVGGPSDIEEQDRRRRVTRDSSKVKLARLGGYEHFERDARAGTERRVLVFRWVYRTRIAE